MFYCNVLCINIDNDAILSLYNIQSIKVSYGHYAI